MASKPTYKELEQRIKTLERALATQNSSGDVVESRYRDTMDNIMEGCQLIDFNWRYLYVNQAAARHGKKKVDRLVGRKITELYPGIEYTEVFLNMRHCMKRRETRHMENEFDFPNGSKGWFELSIQPVPEGIFVLSIDITDRKLAEAAVHEQRERLIEAQRIARMGDFKWDVASGEVTWSEALFELLGYDKNESIDYATVNRDIHHPDDLEEVDGWLTSCIESGRDRLTPKEYRIFRKNGDPIHVRTVGRIQRGKDGSAKIFATVQDISNSKQAQKDLRESEARYRNLFMHSPDAVIVNIKDRVTLANRASLNLFGAKEPDQLIGISVFDLIHPDHHAAIKSGLENLRDPSSPHPPLEHKIIRRDGQVVDVEVVAAPFEFGGEDAIHVIIHDLTSRIRAERERKNLQSQLLQAQKMESIGLLAGGVAHDFNNLLAIILGYGGLMADRLERDEEGRKFLTAILDAGQRAKELVGQLLAFSRKQALIVKPVNVNHILADFKKLLRRTIPEHIDLGIHTSKEVTPVLADAGQLEQVVMNLAVNAMDAMPDGGRLTIETEPVTLGDEYAASHLNIKPGKYVMLSVSDTGTGMDEKTRSLVFDPFFSTKGKQGTGLGLATAYGIIRQHNGYIWVYSEPGQGSTFKIYLPATEQTPIDMLGLPSTISTAKGSETILVVEDDRDMRKIVNIILEAHGYEVIVAANGEEALTRLQEHPRQVHLLLTDVIMPGMNGKELYLQCGKLRPELKVLYMSGYTDNIIAHHGVLDSEVNFMQKPFSQKTLAQKVRRILDE